MAEDIREAILSRLGVLMDGLSGVDSVTRNVNLDDDASQTRIVILEGDETVSEDEPTQRPANAPRVVSMHPQILIAIGDKAQDVGPALSALRGRVIQAITTDATLLGLTINGRGARYIGMESDLAFGRMMTAQMAIKYQFAYLLRPDQFA